MSDYYLCMECSVLYCSLWTGRVYIVKDGEHDECLTEVRCCSCPRIIGSSRALISIYLFHFVENGWLMFAVGDPVIEEGHGTVFLYSTSPPPPPAPPLCPSLLFIYSTQLPQRTQTALATSQLPYFSYRPFVASPSHLRVPRPPSSTLGLLLFQESRISFLAIPLLFKYSTYLSIENRKSKQSFCVVHSLLHHSFPSICTFTHV
jgi:hypothetical protein